MARFTKQQLLDSINVQAVNDIVTLSGSKLPSGQSSSMQDIREGVTDLLTFGLQSVGEAFRHLYDVSNAEAVIYQLNGDNPDGQYQMTLLANGEAGGLVIPDPQGGPDIETGYQLMPIVTGAPVTPGIISPSDPFDGESELDVGDIPNTLKIRHDGQITISASCLPEIDGGQNRQIECDIAVFDDQGVPTTILGFRTSVNNSTGGRGNSATVPAFTIQSSAILPAGSNIGMVIRKNEAPATVVDIIMNRSFILVNYNSLAKT
jgi:hypothetical protein